MRQSKFSRVTKETNIQITLELDGNGESNIETPIPFLNHILDSFTFYSGMNVQIKASGDIEIDDHHLVEDIGISLGIAFKEALGDKIGIKRFASNLIPMDEALIQTAIDISNRPKLVLNHPFTLEKISNLTLANLEEFLYAFVIESRITLHQSVVYGKNAHHIAEAMFKSLGLAIAEAKQVVDTKVISTKGVL